MTDLQLEIRTTVTDAAIAALIDASRTVGATAPDVAADLAGRACALMGDDDPRRSSLVAAIVGSEDLEARLDACVAQSRLWHADWHRLQGRALLESGRLADARAALDLALPENGDLRAETPAEAAALVTRARIAIHLGDARAARACVKAAEGALGAESSEVQCQARWVLAIHALAAGDGDRARAHLATPEVERDPARPTVTIDVTDPVPMARIALAAGDQQLARAALAQADERRDVDPDLEVLRAVASHVRGLVDGDLESLADAATRFASGSLPISTASAFEDYGVALVNDGDEQRGIDALGEALQLYATGAATWDVARVRRRLRRLGVRRRLTAPTRPTSGWLGLTGAELSVVRLVADGLKNREVAERLFISPHTVSMHLRHCFTKLDINSRVELSRLVFTHEQAA